MRIVSIRKVTDTFYLSPDYLISSAKYLGPEGHGGLLLSTATLTMWGYNNDPSNDWHAATANRITSDVVHLHTTAILELDTGCSTG